MLKRLLTRYCKPKIPTQFCAKRKHEHQPMLDGSVPRYDLILALSDKVMKFAMTTNTHMYFAGIDGYYHIGADGCHESGMETCQTLLDLTITSSYRISFDSQDDLDFFLFNFGEHFWGFTE